MNFSWPQLPNLPHASAPERLPLNEWPLKLLLWATLLLVAISDHHPPKVYGLVVAFGILVRLEYNAPPLAKSRQWQLILLAALTLLLAFTTVHGSARTIPTIVGCSILAKVAVHRSRITAPDR